MQWKAQHPDWEEIQCQGCKQLARGTPAQIADWIPRHEKYSGHRVEEQKSK